MTTFSVKCEGGATRSAVGKLDADRVTITLESGKTLTILTLNDSEILRCVVSGGADMVAIYPRASSVFNIDLI